MWRHTETFPYYVHVVHVGLVLLYQTSIIKHGIVLHNFLDLQQHQIVFFVLVPTWFKRIK